MAREQVLSIPIRFDNCFSEECRDEIMDVDRTSLLLLREMEIIQTRTIMMIDHRMIIMECTCNP